MRSTIDALRWTLLASSLALAGCGTTIHGVVTQEDTGAPISGATVQVDEQTVRTDEDGSYAVDVEDDELLWVHVAAPDHTPRTQEVLIRGQGRVALNYQLAPEGADDARQAAVTGREPPADLTLEAASPQAPDRADRVYRARQDRSGGHAATEQTIQAIYRSLVYVGQGDESRAVLILGLPGDRRLEAHLQEVDRELLERLELYAIGQDPIVRVRGHFELVDGRVVFMADQILIVSD